MDTVTVFRVISFFSVIKTVPCEAEREDYLLIFHPNVRKLDHGFASAPCENKLVSLDCVIGLIVTLSVIRCINCAGKERKQDIQHSA